MKKLNLLLLFLSFQFCLYGQNNSTYILTKNHFEEFKGTFLQSDGFGGKSFHLHTTDSVTWSSHGCLGSFNHIPATIYWINDSVFEIMYSNYKNTFSVFKCEEYLFIGDPLEIAASLQEYDSIKIKAETTFNLLKDDPETRIEYEDIFLYLLMKKSFIIRKH